MLLRDSWEFCSRLYAGYPADEGLTIELRPLAPRGAAPDIYVPKPLFFGLNDKGIRALCSDAVEWRDTLDVYLGVLPRDGRRGRDQDCPLAGWLSADIDGGDEKESGTIRLLTRWKEAGFPSPGMLVESGSGGAHVYWRLSEPFEMRKSADREVYSSLLRRLCKAIGGALPGAHADTTCVNPSRILRVPGTFNRKTDPPRPTRLQITPAEPTSLCWWQAHLPFEPLPDPARQIRAKPSPTYVDGGIAPGIIRHCSHPIPEGKRHPIIMGNAVWLIRDCGLTHEQAADLLYRQAAMSTGKHPITRQEVEDMIRWVK